MPNTATRLRPSAFGKSGCSDRWRREAHATSDLDFLVELKAKSFDAYLDLKFFLEDLFQRRVDLVLADALKPRLRPAILAEALYAEGFEGLA